MEVILIFRQLNDREIERLTASKKSEAKIYSLPGLFIDKSLDVELIPENIVKEASNDLINTLKK